MQFSRSSRQIPYLVLDGQEYSDSSLIIDMLADRLGFDSREGLHPEQQAVARAFTKMLDESTAWWVGQKQRNKSVYTETNSI